MNPDQLLKEYTQLSTHAERAEFEYSLWKHYKGIQDSKRAAKTVIQTLNITEICYRARRAIYKLDFEQSKILWNKLENGTPICTIYRLVTHAKRYSKPFNEALAIELDKYEKKAFTTRLSNGKLIKKKSPIFKKETEIGISLVVREKSNKSFWSQIKMMIIDHFENKLDNLLEIDKDNLLKEFEIDLKTLIIGWQSRVIRTSKNKIKFGTTIDRKKLIRACKILQVKPPSINEPIDLNQATKQMKKLTRLYHPDVHGGKEETRDLFEEAIGAHEVLKEYSQFLKLSRQP